LALARTCLSFTTALPHTDPHAFPTRRSSDLASSPSGTSASLRFEANYRRRSEQQIPSETATTKSNSPSINNRARYGHSSATALRSEEHTSELQSRFDLVCRLLLEKKNYHSYL